MNSSVLKDGLTVSRIGLGCVQFGMDYGFRRKRGDADVFGIFDRARELGIDLLDTARDYGDSEGLIGRYHESRGVRPFKISTKISRIVPGADVARQLRDSVERSLTELCVPVLDFLFLHQTDAFVYQNAAFWHAVAELKKEGLCRFFGISVYEPEPTRAVILERSGLIDAVQAPYNVFDRRFEGLFGFLRERGITMIGRSVFLKGVLTVESDRLPPELGGIKPFKRKFEKIADRSDFTAAELALLFAYQNPFLDSVLVGVDSVAELEADARIATCPQLKDGILCGLDELRVQDPFLIDPRQWKQL